MVITQHSIISFICLGGFSIFILVILSLCVVPTPLYRAPIVNRAIVQRPAHPATSASPRARGRRHAHERGPAMLPLTFYRFIALSSSSPCVVQTPDYPARLA